MEREELLTAIEAQEHLRGVIPDEVIDATITTLRSQLEDVPVRAQRRRQVTVLFADVSGFTAMSESLDAEVVAEFMNELWARLDMVVVDHGGRIDKHIGDALMAVWGAEASAEDDAERAVRAALGLQTELERLLAVSGRDLAMRIGVNTGPVLVGPVGSTQEFTVMGDTVNTASRLEHAAPRGGVLISHDTYRQVRGVFDVEAIEPIAFKGKAEPLRVYVAKAEKERAFRLRNRGVEGVETATIGRDYELVAMCNAFKQVNQTGHGRSVVVVGEAGIGKSRLLYEFDNWLELHEQGVFYFKARAIRARTETRLGVWRDLLAFRAGVAEGDAASSVFKKLRAETEAVLDDRETMVLGLWLGFELPDPSAASRLVSGENLAFAGKAHLWAYVRSLIVESPVVMLFEDLHWADGASLDLLNDLISQFADDRLLTVAATRPERSGAERMVDVLGPAWQPISLVSLNEPATRALVAEILKRVDHLPDSLVDLVVERADGNPFFIEELIKKLIDDGSIVADADVEHWSADVAGLDEATIPRTLTGVLQARFDVLTKSGRRSLQRASVVGRTFWESAVEVLGSESADLDQAVKNELLFRRRQSTFPQTSEFTFKHALLHDVAYDTVLLSERPTLHQRAAEWLNDVVGERRDEYLEEIAGHLLLADRHDQAAELLAEAAARALNSGDASTARRLATTAFQSSAIAAARSNGHLTLARACRLLGDLQTAEEEADRAIQFAETEGDDSGTIAAIHEAFFLWETQGAHERGRLLVERGRPIAERLGGASLTRMLACSAWSDHNAGNLEGARRNAAEHLRRAEQDGRAEVVIEAHKITGMLANAVGDHERAMAHDRRALEMAASSGDLKELAVGHLNIGVTWHYLADLSEDKSEYDSAQTEYETALTLTKRLGFRSYEAQALANLAQLHMRRGQLDLAESLAKECLTVSASIGAHLHALFAVLVHAETRYEATGSPDALTHVGFVRSDPGLGRLSSEVVDVIERIRNSHPRIDIDDYLDAGASLDFNDVVRHILDGP